MTNRCKQVAAVVTACALMFGQVAAPIASADSDRDERELRDHPGDTESPIKHVIVIIGENRTFDHIFGTYRPKRGQTVRNLLSQGIVKADGTPGQNFHRARQFTVPPQATYFIDATDKTPYVILPAPTLGGAPNVPSNPFLPLSPSNPGVPPFALPLAVLGALEPGLEASDLILLTTGATGAAGRTGTDNRIPNATQLPNGPFQLTGPTLSYDTYTGDTIHRFYQMWQQTDCSLHNATHRDPTGCLSDLYPFVTTTFAGPTADEGGGSALAFYNVQQGDAPFLKQLADEFTMSDNFHQSFMGGTGANHVMLGTGDAIFWSDGKGSPTAPPASQIANPNPRPGTNNRYTVDQRYSDCSDLSQPGVAPIVTYLKALHYDANPNCAPRHFYMLNNTSPGFLPNGAVDMAGIASGSSVPPSNVRTIGDALSEKNVGWAYYGGAFRAAVNLANGSTNPADLVGLAYCDICNFESYASSIMTDPAARTTHLKDVLDLFDDLRLGTLPAVSFVKPDGLLDGHPATSKVDLFEAFVKNILDRLDANAALKATTAVLITFDEGGGYYDSGFIQPIDYFGDGPRIPLIAVSPFSKGGKIVHSYTDHVSILKFIERNWRLKPLTSRSRDNLPNPRSRDDNPYVPTNMPAIGDLFDMFNLHDDGDD
ncbi:MAG TPA: alkaline phosphatase family protein [Vicinamibacterales bacterium]|nr:alkaline phosphatase family protein [Vicinamibacterales bacterium]